MKEIKHKPEVPSSQNSQTTQKAHPRPATPIDTILNALHYQKERTSGNYMCLCPAHDDSRHSLSVKLNQDGKILLHCFAGCSTESILAAAGLKMKDLFPPPSLANFPHKSPTTAPTQLSQITAVYAYTNAQGTLLYQVVRKAPKGFYQRQPAPTGGWINHLNGVERVLYHLPELLQAPPATPIFIVEGEKDADNLRQQGLIATTNAQGAGKWQAHYNQHLAGRPVCILPDNDDAGCKHAHAIATQLQGIAAEVKLIELPGLPPKGDVSDWLQTGGTAEKLLALVVAAPPYFAPPHAPKSNTEPHTPPSTAIQILPHTASKEHSNPPHNKPHNTDIGNAQRMFALVQDRVIYVPNFGKWYIWTGTHWHEDNNFTIMALAKQTVLQMYTEVVSYQDDEQRREFLKWIMRSESLQRLEAMISLLRSEPGISVSPDMLDRQALYLPCTNGTINLSTGELERANPAHKFTKCLDIVYDPAAQCPVWQSFLMRIMDNNADLVAFIQRLVGHALTGDATGKYLVFMWGPKGNNGKSTLAEVIMRLLGPYALKSPTEMVMVKSYRGGVPNDIARLRSIRFTVTNEVDDGMTLSESIVKDLTGRDTLTARFMREEFFDFVPTHKLWIYGNHRPEIRGTDPAIWDRVKLLPFEVEIPEAERDPHLLDKLTLELEGILAWAVAGCLAWQKVGIQPPPTIKAATDEYRYEQDLISQFLEECCEFDPIYCIASATLYAAYVAWCNLASLDAETGTKFGTELGRRGYTKNRRVGIRLRQGLQLRSHASWLIKENQRRDRL